MHGALKLRLGRGLHTRLERDSGWDTRFLQAKLMDAGLDIDAARWAACSTLLVSQHP